tara:strand:- start:48 stop:1091 length:1044 start_codon:yes stop_codon:yes gene_type:complete
MRLRKSQEGLIIAGFALATVMIIALLVTYLSNRVVDMIAIQNQVFFSKQAYWNAYSGMELTTSEKIVSLDGIPNAEVSFATGTITIDPTTTANAYLGGNKVATIASTGSDAGGRSRTIKLTIGDPKVDYALLFDGINDYVTMGDVHDVGTSDFTISVWFRYSATDNTLPQLVNKYNGGMGYGLEIVDDGTDDGKVRAYIRNNDTRTEALSSVVIDKIDGNWHHAAATWDRDGNLTVYLDGTAGTGVSIATQSGNDIQNALAFVIGAEDNHTAQFFEGLINDVALWNSVLSEEEVQTLYIQGYTFSATNIASGNLSGYWNFNDQSDLTADVSGNGNTGDIDGAVFTGT